MEEQDRQRIIRQKLVRMEQTAGARSDRPIPTGFPSLDSAMGGGLPRGSIVEIFGPASSGKSTIALQISARAVEAGAAPAWIDAEHVFDPGPAARIGLTLERMPVMRPDSAEQALEMSRRLVESGALDLLVIDSAAALVPRLELETGLAGGYGLQSRVLGSGLRKLRVAAARYGVAVLILNQSRTRLRSGEAEEETSAGGPGLKLYADVRISLAPAGGNEVRFRIIRNKAGAAFVEGRLRWESGWTLTERP